MSRQPRFLPPDNYFHIMNRGNNFLSIFKNDDDFLFYLDKLKQLKSEHPFELYHYCLMSTHLHLLVKVTKKSDFSNFSKRLNSSYASYFKKVHGYIGHFWQGRFKSQLIDADPYFIQCGKYIELNPAKADIVQNPKDYPWSSYCYYAFGESNNLLTEDIFYDEMGYNDEERQKKYRDLTIDQTISDQIDKTDFPPIGSKKFVYNVSRRLKVHKNNKHLLYRKSRI